MSAEKIVNLTQHPATPEQVAAGVVDLQGSSLEALKSMLDFGRIPTAVEINNRALAIAGLAYRCEANAAMIGGALWLMAPLAETLRRLGIIPMFAFSQRETVEETLPDGGVRKVAVFRHKGFVEAVEGI